MTDSTRAQLPRLLTVQCVTTFWTFVREFSRKLTDEAHRELASWPQATGHVSTLFQEVLAELKNDEAVNTAVLGEAEKELCNVRSEFEDFDRDLAGLQDLDRNVDWLTQAEREEVATV